MSADVGAAYRRAVLRLRERLSRFAIEEFVARGDYQSINRLILDDREFVRAFIGYTREVRRGVERATISYAKTLPPAPSKRVLDGGFDMLNPNVVESVRTLETRSLSTIQEEMRATVRQVVERGIRGGVNPRETARHLRSVIGLAPNQERAIANFEKALRSGDFSKALGYELRDGRSDALLKRLVANEGTLTEAQIDRQVKAYRQNWEAWNAETHARTASLDAQRLGQRLSWQQAKDSGALGDREITKKWVTARDDRVRPEHEDMDGVEIPFDSRWPVDGGVMVPGENTYNCFAADTVVEGAVVGGLKARYSGEMVELTTLRGHRLTVTPNHPVLTPEGWLPARALREGGALFSNSRVVGAIPTRVDGVDEQQAPSAVEQVFQSMRVSRSAVVRSDDLHGDAALVVGEVDVVRTASDLVDEPGMLGANRVDDRRFGATEFAPGSLEGFRAPDADAHRIALAASSGVRGAHLASDARRVALDVGPLQALSIGPAAHFDTDLGEPSKQDDAIVPAFIRELLHASAGAIALDQIVEVRNVEAVVTRHVYDLQTVTGWILAGGIVCSNCRCIAMYRVQLQRVPTGV